MRRPLLAIPLTLLATPVLAVTIDGHIRPGEWQGARHITDFRQTQPMTGKPASLPTDAWVLATPAGLAVAFRATQPPAVTRTTQQVQRDFEEPVDRVNVMVDFNGDGLTGYNFTIASTGGVFDAVMSNESQFSKDWDGLWQHAVSSDADGYTVEVLIPWSIAPMHKANGGKRVIGLYLDRVVGSTGERVAWPDASFMRARFLSDFAPVEVPAYRQSLLAVTPYASAVYDNIRQRSQFDAGLDVLWKPNGQFQLTASLNPDFGQVESDDLVVNFSATESYFSDKRPFFTENQSLFNFGLLDDNSALIYTRRVGGPADDGKGAGDITAAVKFNGSVGTTNYGVLAANESGAAGRFFSALRLSHDFDRQSVGVMLTRVERPWLDRSANVLGVDHHWQPTPAWTVWSTFSGSDIAQRGARTRGYGATALVDYDMGRGWRQQWALMHFDDRFQINDFGYLSRNNLDYLHWELRKRITDLAPDSRYSSHDWRLRVDALDNDHGLRLRRELRLQRESELRNGGDESLRINVDSAAWDDLLTRGHGALWLPSSFSASYSHSRPRQGDWGFEWEAELNAGGLAGVHRIGWEVGVEPTYFLSDALRLRAELEYGYTPSWLVWQTDNSVGEFARRSLELEAGFDWSIDQRQELRFKLQAIGLDAAVTGAWRVGSDGRAQAAADVIEDFSVRNLGLQVRYRYQLAPLSWLYVVYGRGGYDQDARSDEPGRLLDDALRLRDDEQLLVKLNYRFDI